jgi:hypothetical protein
MALLIILIIVGAIWYRSSKMNNNFPDPSELVGWKQYRTTTRPPTPMQSVLERKITARPLRPHSPSPTPSPLSSPPPPTNTLFELCESDWLRLANTNERDLQTTLERRQRFLTRPCLMKMKTDLKTTLLQNFTINCQIQIAKQTNPYIQENCLPQLTPFRAFLIRKLRADLIDFHSLELPDLANQLLGGFIDLRQAPEDELQRNIQIADAIIAKDPDFYPAYKAKLLSLLVEELKFGAPHDLDTYQSLYDELLSFRGTNQNESILIEALALRDQDSNSAEIADIDSDLIHIPFLRLSALEDINGLADMAEEYIEAYPNSYIGQLYLAEAAWKSGDPASAINIFRKVMGQETSDDAILNVLKTLESKRPLERIMEMGL